jgi:glycosyltransferase involved in cell wall biosynthesis
MSRSARVGIGLPVYNGENYLCTAIESVLAQTFTDIALIISDNASTDGTREICLRYARADHRVQYHRSDVNRGLLWNFNQVFRLCTSEYFMWFSHDDALEPAYVERCVLILDADPTAVLSFSACRDIDGEGQTIGVRRSTVAMDSSDPIARFREGIRLEHLCESWCGLTRSDAIRRTPLFGSYADYDRVMIAELGLRGRLSCRISESSGACGER